MTRYMIYTLMVLFVIFQTSQIQAFSLLSSSCLIQPDKIICNGPAITDTSLVLLKNELHTRYNHIYFLELLITDTEISKIDSGTFVDVELENVYILNNKLLTYIASDAFAEQSAKTLIINNNPLLKNNSVYQLTNKLHVSEYVDFDFNGLVEVPSNAFNGQLNENVYSPIDSDGVSIKAQHFLGTNRLKKTAFKKLVLSHNQINRINSNGFRFMEKCTEIYLNFNKLKYIATHGFNLIHPENMPLTSEKFYLKIFLDNNHLNSNSLETDFIQWNDYLDLSLDLSCNNITELKKNVFQNMLTKNITIDFTKNPLNCLSVGWLQSEPEMMAKTKGILC